MTETSTIKKKLKGMGPILWINLDTETNRQEHMNGLFDFYEIPNTRISAIDARGNNDVSDLLIGRYPELVTQGELGCTMSHLKAIKHFYFNTQLDSIIICEDDIVFDTVSTGHLLGMDLCPMFHMIGMYCSVPLLALKT